ncbi:hypothetical protein X777_15981 [Ooceraea biroi]|uniref:Uncharacterized protein n=1 Tax=Ooceraea biroi TaxID=2015173 RepID=A0A026WTE6_OOCBI|nr:hypothetical protein X777_15981 [Ooceraea biroi]
MYTHMHTYRRCKQINLYLLIYMSKPKLVLGCRTSASPRVETACPKDKPTQTVSIDDRIIRSVRPRERRRESREELSTSRGTFVFWNASAADMLFMRNPVARGGENGERRRPESCGGKRTPIFSSVASTAAGESCASHPAGRANNPLLCVALRHVHAAPALRVDVEKA